jgi:dihydroxyacetone kinase-like predicted kinase
VPSKNVPQGISAMVVYANARLHPDQRGELDFIVAGMRQALEQVLSGEVTAAVRSVNMDGVRARAGQLIGLLEDRLVVAGDDINRVVGDLIGRVDDETYELVTLYYGIEVSPPEAQALRELLQATYEAFSFEVIPGGQPHYHYLISVE